MPVNNFHWRNRGEELHCTGRVWKQSVEGKDIVPQWYIDFCKEVKMLNCFYYMCFWSECKIIITVFQQWLQASSEISILITKQTQWDALLCRAHSVETDNGSRISKNIKKGGRKISKQRFVETTPEYPCD